ncbi:hypothetical protein RvY_00161 [Ramazzottius varieornatus]|uniref:Receptor ligand binding region domain-containing protein n=1 Tax=Ramazzottius varieornatus TaxID=947166 RepID=A0A1D1UI47_RAMVA|nr:hypothetical protein RvY_00161 [Ramazzottius varieornatus]
MLMDKYKWQTISFTCDISTEFGEYTRDFYRGTCNEFAAALTSQQGYKIFSQGANLSKADERISALQDAKLYSRVIVVISHMDYVRQVLLTASQLNMTTPEYDAAKVFESLFIVTLARLPATTKTLALFDAIEHVAKDSYNLSSPVTESGLLYGTSTYSALHVTAQTVGEAIQLNKSLSDGSRLVKLMHNRTFATPCGVCEMNHNGDLESIYAIVGMSQQTKNFEVYLYTHEGKVLAVKSLEQAEKTAN